MACLLFLHTTPLVSDRSLEATGPYRHKPYISNQLFQSNVFLQNVTGIHFYYVHVLYCCIDLKSGLNLPIVADLKYSENDIALQKMYAIIAPHDVRLVCYLGTGQVFTSAQIRLCASNTHVSPDGHSPPVSTYLKPKPVV